MWYKEVQDEHVQSARALFSQVRVIWSTSHQLLRSVRRMLCMPVSGPWYAWLTSLIISSAVRLSPGANGWFHCVKMYESGSGVVCCRKHTSVPVHACFARPRTYRCHLVQLPLDREAEVVQIWGDEVSAGD